MQKTAKDESAVESKKEKVRKNFSQFMSYIVVGGSATAVEWILFFVFLTRFKWNQNLAFTVAYAISTFVNMILGRLLTFRHASVVGKSDSPVRNLMKETSLIYLVAVIGCGFNLLFLNLFTGIFHMDSMLAKIMTTGIMTIGNYLARKLGIYRDNRETADNPS